MSGDIEDVVGEFNPGEYEAPKTFEPLPAGWYTAMIENAEVKDTKRGDGKYLKVVFVIVGDEGKGRKLFTNINLANPNPKAVEIGQRELANLGQSLGLARVKDCTDLKDKVVECKVAIKKEDGRDPDNEIKQYRHVNGTAAQANAASTAAAAKPAAAPAAKQAKSPAQMPWMKN